MIQKMVIDMSGRGGLSNKWFGDINKFGYTGATETGNTSLRYLAKDGEIVNGFSNPVIKYGYNSPIANTFLTVTVSGGGTAISKTIPISLVDDRLKNVWFGCNNSHLYVNTGYYNAGVTDVVTISSALQALVTFTDACYYQINGAPLLMFAWVGSSKGYISTIEETDITGATFNENWSQADVANPMEFGGGAKTLRMIPSGDGYLYILDETKVHRLDGSTLGGANGTLYQNVLVGSGFIQFHSGIEYKNKLYIVLSGINTVDNNTLTYDFGSRAHMRDRVGIYVWNKQASFFNSSDFIQLPGVQDVRAIWISPKGDLRILCLETTGEASLRIFDGTNFKTVEYLPFGALPPTQKSIRVHGAFSYWIGNDGLIYGYGSDIPGESDFLFILGQFLSNGQGTNIGGTLAITATSAGDAPPASNKPSDVFWIGYATATNNGFLKTFYPYASNTIATTNNIARHNGNVYYPVKLIPTLSTVKHINIIMARTESLATPTQVEAVISFYFNQSTTASFSKNITREDISKGYISVEINKPFVNSIQMGVVHNQNSNIGVADFTPAYAEVVYDTTGALK